MAAITSNVQIEAIPNAGVKMLLVTVNDATVDNGDTFTVTLANYGITNVWAVLGWIHTTSNSVIVAENPTTSVTSGVLTVTVGGSTANKIRAYVIIGL